MTGLERIVLEHPFFADLGEAFAEAISGCARNMRVAAGEYLFREGGAADEFYLIRHGTIALEIHAPGRQPIIVATLGAGEVLDGSWLVPPYRWAFDARAVELSRLLGVNAKCLRDKCEADHDLGYELMKRFVGAMGENIARRTAAGARRLWKPARLTRIPDTIAQPNRKADCLVPQPFAVARARKESADVATIELTPSAPFAFDPGQFNMLYAFGLGEVAISLSGDPKDTGKIVHTVRAVGAVSAAITRLRRGAVIGVRGPYGSAWPVAESEGNDIVIVAGGLGLAPLRPAIYAVLARRKRYGRVVVLYGARSPAEILFRRELEDWRRRLDIDILVTVDHAAADWRGNVGVVPALIPRIAVDPDHAVAMVCGPEIMMRFTIDALRQRGLPADQIFLSMERNMKCAVGLCGHCQFGPAFVCRDGPVFRFDQHRRDL